MIKPKEMANRLGISVKTLQRWDREGRLVAYRNIKNRRYYTEDQYLTAIGQMKAPDKVIVGYARVSSHHQTEALQNQITFIRQFVNARGEILDNVYSDIGSGLNYKRKNWNKIIFDLILQGKVSKIYITYKDRFVRFGFDWFQNLCEKYDCEIIVIKNEDTSPQQELVQDLISIIHVFSSRVYGLRTYKQKLRKDNPDAANYKDNSQSD